MKRNLYKILLLLFLSAFIHTNAHPVFSFLLKTGKVLYHPDRKRIELLNKGEYITDVTISTQYHGVRENEDLYEVTPLSRSNIFILSDSLHDTIMACIKKKIDVDIVVFTTRLWTDPKIGRLEQTNKYIFDVNGRTINKRKNKAFVNFDAQQTDTLGFSSK